MPSATYKPTFTPAWWIPGPHAQTLWGKVMRRIPPAATRLERWDTPDGDFVDIHRLQSSKPGDDAPHLLILHGLEGTIRSHYAQGLLTEAHRRGWNADLLIFRSCGDTINRTRRFYHSGETTDLAFVLDRIIQERPNARLLLTGVSLGGNVLLKYLGESRSRLSPQIIGAATVSVPFDLARGSKYLQRGFGKVYERHFLRSLEKKVLQKLETFPDLVDPAILPSLESLYDFDDRVTAPIHGFRDAADYYKQSSSINYLNRISINTLLLNSMDDPFLPPSVLDEVRKIADSNSHLIVEFPSKGGHAGFIGGRNPFNPVYYLERRVGDFFATLLGGL